MINRAIHILSNSAGPFDLFGLPVNPEFEPRLLSREQTSIRRLLMLDRGDYYVNAFIAALAAYPDISQSFDDNQTFDIQYQRPFSVQMEGAEFLVDTNIKGRWLDTDRDLPLNLNYTISYATSSLVTITGVDRLNVYTSKYIVSGTDPEKVLHIEWPDQLPFSGPLRLKQTWTTGALVSIKVRPQNFPYASLVNRVLGNAYLTSRLHQLLLQEEFRASEDPVEKAAMIAVALITDDVEPGHVDLPDEKHDLLNPFLSITCDQTGILCDNSFVTCDHT